VSLMNVRSPKLLRMMINLDIFPQIIMNCHLNNTNDFMYCDIRDNTLERDIMLLMNDISRKLRNRL
jgi:hypothetical protein